MCSIDLFTRNGYSQNHIQEVTLQRDHFLSQDEKSQEFAGGDILTVIITNSESDTLSITWQAALVRVYRSLGLTGPLSSR